MTRLTRYELRLLLRDPGATIPALILPAGVIALFGAIAPPDTVGDDPITSFFPVAAIALALGQLGMNLLPTTLVGYREKGILRRMATTPVPPVRLLAAQLAAGVLLAVTSVIIVVGVSVFAFGFRPPGHVPAFLVVLTLGLLSIYAVGLVVAAVAPNARVATGAGVLLFFTGIAVGGVMVPTEAMPPFLNAAAEYTPLGAFVLALRAAWEGAWPAPAHLLVMAGYAAVCLLASVKMFRWE